VHLIRAPRCGLWPMGTASRSPQRSSPSTPPNQDAALEALADFADQWGVKYPETVATWESAWERFTAVPGVLRPMLRRVIYTTNSIESLNYQLRKVSKNRGQHPLRSGRRETVTASRSATPVDKRARQREKEAGLPASKRPAKARLIEGQVTTN